MSCGGGCTLDLPNLVPVATAQKLIGSRAPGKMRRTNSKLLVPGYFTLGRGLAPPAVGIPQARPFLWVLPRAPRLRGVYFAPRVAPLGTTRSTPHLP